ncbi:MULTISPECIES: helix-turn-helix domain-containing protein [Pseudomonas]|jgi:transcriptional regulator with XRE-family HTH domain|uniref:helix-turn-helix domain-containing protein n=1 Tax=Pseudomonas TaxID=286 RepID=UPI000E31901B|nr:MULTISPECIES: helix-turn-helix transcriptional regulator [Pseudomonas]AZF28697.1 putative transcriptional regulator [Pseudomonas sp. R2-60-08W]MBK3472710.1 helix-turn-helix transcriptional regulator [Pseudomonas carnis]RFD31706.1 transcriptional regulator [Pseudomonas sp. GL93]
MSDVMSSGGNDFGNRLRQAREYVGLSQEEVATALGLSRPSITNIELGARKVEAAELGKLAKLYRRTLDYLLTGVEPAPNGPEQLAFLARAVKGLSEKDLEEVARFAEFLKQSLRNRGE